MRRALYLLSVLALAVAAYLAGSEGRRTRASRTRVDPAKIPGIVVLCIDTLRADAMFAEPDAPGLASLRAFSRSATTFSEAYAPSSWTLPSIASLLTGLDPLHHGVVEMAPGSRLAAAVPTLAERLREAGFFTVASTGGGWVSDDGGLSSGFDRFDADFDRRSGDPDAAARLVRGAVRDAGPDRPFFLFLHTYAAHDPYGDKGDREGTSACEREVDGLLYDLQTALESGTPVPADLRQRFLLDSFGDPCRRRAIDARIGALASGRAWLDGCRDWLDGAWRAETGGPAAVRALRLAYRKGLRHVDGRVRAVLDAVESLPPDTIVVVAGDHGEAFGEHGPLHHGRFLFREFVHVPLVVRARGLAPGALVETPCSLVDLVPTLLDLCGLPRTTPLDGESLLARARSGVVRSVVAPAHDAGDRERHLRRIAVRDATAAWIGTLDIRTIDWVEERAFDRRADPEERSPLSALPAATAAFHEAVARARADLASRYRPWRQGP